MKNKLQSMREKRFVSQAELANIADISLKTLQGYEQNQKDLKKAAFGTVYKLAAALNSNILDIINKEDLEVMQHEIHLRRCQGILKKAKKINQYEDIPQVMLGDIVPIKKVWDSKGEVPEESYSYLLTHDGYNGESNCPIWINYCFQHVNPDEPNLLKRKVKITDIEFL